MGSKPRRIQRKRTRGWRMPKNTVSVTRPGKFGNPFKTDILTREESVEAFRNAMSGCFDGPSFKRLTDEEFRVISDRYQDWLPYWPDLRRLVTELRGKDLACFCPLDKPCHADILLELANKEDSQ